VSRPEGGVAADMDIRSSQVLIHDRIAGRRGRLRYGNEKTTFVSWTLRPTSSIGTPTINHDMKPSYPTHLITTIDTSVIITLQFTARTAPAFGKMAS
jgi:hypothetical protein